MTASPTPAPAESFGQPQATFAEASAEAVAQAIESQLVVKGQNPET
jgi:hypothetical protein